MFSSSIPTDNLYKFMAITGLVFIVLCLYWYNKQLHEVMMESIELRSQVESMAKINSILDEKKKIVEGTESSTSKDAMEILNERAALLKESPTISKRWERLFFLTNEFIRLKKILILSLVLGVATTCAGFFLWYMKLQRYQDVLMKREAQKTSPAINGKNESEKKIQF